MSINLWSYFIIIKIIFCTADIVFAIEEKPHPHYSRDNDNLIYTANIALEKALTGTTLEIVSALSLLLTMHSQIMLTK